MPKRQASEQLQGGHPSGVAICQRCGYAASLRAAYSGLPGRVRRRTVALCADCYDRAAVEAERFGLALDVTPLL